MKRKYIDLTFPIHEGMTTFPVHWHPFVEITILGRHGIENRETRKILLGTHTGTHMDAPRHFITDGATVDQVPLDVLIGPALVLDFSHARPFQEITKDEVAAALGASRPERVILRYDWSDHWGTGIYYSDHPFLAEDAARFLVDQGVRLIAMDTPMPDNPKNGKGTANDSPCHKITLGKDVILVEYLCNLRSITRPQVELIVLPLKIRDGDGSPVRCVVIEED